ncbi:hypothetical protein FMM01_04620 [Schleiferilactobacillus harbinensis]|nr:hypothetical protein FMM01_04620 [Schleiferilactobacillus harbinensis]
MRSKRRQNGLSCGNNTAALPPMLLGDFETAQRAQSAVTAFQPILPQLAEHLARRIKEDLFFQIHIKSSSSSRWAALLSLFVFKIPSSGSTASTVT